MDEAVTRRSHLYQGRRIKLADGQSWVLPSPSVELEADLTLLGPDYWSLLRAVRKAEGEAERRLCELALAIFLLGCNYELSPIGYQRMLCFPPGAPELIQVQKELHRLAQDHLVYLSDDPDVEKGRDQVAGTEIGRIGPRKALSFLPLFRLSSD
jgi:hypothetical protein